ncbi:MULTISPECIES: phosphoenolpyruvate--protein phosphotransferase [Collinsella]|uniref:phosphoenolpyruvate--protein phosphotransferase n=1 Tax=Collinsella TaxID=102106 RepID=UPI000B3800BC|nr:MULTISPECIES: phosphoenolpyruvate--protein phosphotransferase [Collinsella]MBM6941491.1 phosphoenolpyruvate--protein phosphotransferase [Collinsella intestinalis]OUO63512.1 phosphoenolpyruvate--protein phosphotransferase [Collinsella sp. An268]
MYEGVNASEGIGIGTVVLAVEPDLSFEPTTVEDAAAEKARYKEALEVFCKKTEAQAERMKVTVGENEAEIMSGHIMLAQDPGLVDGINAAIDAGTCAEQALVETSTMFENMFLSMDDEMFRLRAADIADIRTGILAELLGREVVDLSVLPAGSIVVVHDLTPSMTATIDKENVAGVVTEVGGRTSHSAIIARALEIPAVLSVPNACGALHNGMTVIVDGINGHVINDPTDEQLSDYRQRAEAFAAEKRALEAFRGKPTVTADGDKKVLACNIGNPEDAKGAVDNDAEAIGLFRSEFLFMDAKELPSEEEQFEAYRKVAVTLKGAPVIIRTLDVGGDKEIPYLKLQKEDNPFMGYRAVRYCLDNADEYKVQLRALLRASAFGDIKIMVPLVTCVEELRQVKELVEVCKKELAEEGYKFNENIEVGIMMETAAAANIADILAEEAAFFSIGTNDLTGYTMASDRGNDKVSYLYSWYYPAVLRAIKNIIINGVKAGIMVGMCGEAAADSLLTPLLISWGMEEFSVSAPSVLKTRKAISQWTKADADALEAKVMELKTADEVKAALEEAAR